jgi:hypothetical protein
MEIILFLKNMINKINKNKKILILIYYINNYMNIKNKINN